MVKTGTMEGFVDQRSLTCANCGQKLHVLEVHVCSDCCAELMSDPNSSMYEEEDDE
ncbi:protein ninF [Escherichia coli]